MSVKGPIFYVGYSFLAAILAVQCFFAYRGKEFVDAVAFGMVSVSCIVLMLYAFRTRRPKPPVT